MKTSLFFSIFSAAFVLAVFSSGCCPMRRNFDGMTRAEVAAVMAEKGPKRDDGRFMAAFLDNPVHREFQYGMFESKDRLLYGPMASKSDQWKVNFHAHGKKYWHYDLLTFEKDRVVDERHEKMPYWFFIEP